MKPAIAFDLDGTLSSSAWRQALADAKLWPEYHELVRFDTPIPSVVAQLRECRIDGTPTVVFTARMGTPACRVDTIRWLNRWDLLPSLGVYMRDQDDTRPGPPVKQDMVRKLAALGFQVVSAYEDQSRFREPYAEVGVEMIHVKDPGLHPFDLAPSQVRQMLDDRLKKEIICQP